MKLYKKKLVNSNLIPEIILHLQFSLWIYKTHIYSIVFVYFMLFPRKDRVYTTFCEFKTLYTNS